MLFKRENFNRSYDKVPPVKYSKNFTHRTQCNEQTNSCGSVCRLRRSSPVAAGNVWSMHLTLPWWHQRQHENNKNLTNSAYFSCDQYRPALEFHRFLPFMGVSFQRITREPVDRFWWTFFSPTAFLWNRSVWNKILKKCTVNFKISWKSVQNFRTWMSQEEITKLV